MKTKPKDILQDALKIAEIAYKAAQNEFGYDSGFYGMQQAEIEGSKCLIVSIILAEPQTVQERVHFLGVQNRSHDEAVKSLLESSQIQPEGTTDERKQ